MDRTIPTSEAERPGLYRRVLEQGREEGREEGIRELVRRALGVAAATKLEGIDDPDELMTRAVRMLRGR